MERAALSQPQRGLRRHDVGLSLAIALAFVLAIIMEWFANFVFARSPDTFAIVTVALMALPLLLGFTAIGISLFKRPMWVRVGVAILLLLVPPALVFSGVLHG